jgi:hypothetical protein
MRTLAVAAAGGQRLRQQYQMISALNSGAGRALGRQRLADLGHELVARVQHRSRRPLHDPTHRHDHGESVLLR